MAQEASTQDLESGERSVQDNLALMQREGKS
jgi:hypothetical protein